MTSDGNSANLETGLEILRETVRTLSSSPGVYRMLSLRGDVLYVGKARNLKRRVGNYTQAARLPNRLRRMVAETRAMEVVNTHTEVEALLLESNYIKRLKPRYNVLLRDDKSFPHIAIFQDHDFPRIAKHRGAQTRPGRYFGPFASAGAVNRTIIALQKAFLLRPCTDAVFRARTRPCLQYQIKRCSAPCVGYVDEAAYGDLVAQAHGFLSGGSRDIQERLAEQMQAAADALDFESAVRYRDRIRSLSFVQAHQDINVGDVEDADVVGAVQQGGQTGIEVFFFRGGQNYGSRAYFPSHDRSLALEEVLAAFLAQFYDNKKPPKQILLSGPVAEHELLQEALSLRAGRKVALLTPQRGGKRKLVRHALDNAREALGRRQAESASQRRLLEGVARVFDLDGPPARIEVYDNSHISGASAYGGMIVAGPDGFMKQAYRRFGIKGSGEAGFTPGDDYAMMGEVLTRRFSRALKEDPEREQGGWPDLVLIDGGPGQLSRAVAAMGELGIEDVPLVAISKGPDRDAGRERFHRSDLEPFTLEPNDPVLYYLQRLRDEAHRFAIESHRARRSRSLTRSSLDEVPGVGAKRKKALLLHFGSARAVARAGVEDLQGVEGISTAVAERIYAFFHDADAS